MKSKQIILASRPTGEPDLANFQLQETDLPELGPGDVLLKTHVLSLDPYMRARMYDGKNYAGNVELGAVMVGETVAEVISSQHDRLASGTFVTSPHGWQSHAVVKGDGLRVVDPSVAPISTALHVLGLTGLTAYGGLLQIGQPQPGETLLVSAAAGAVGSVVAQIGTQKGLRVVGLAGGAEKCGYLTDELGIAAVDYKNPDVAAALAAAAPNGIDIYFDNIAGPIAAKVLPHMNRGGRVLVCGTIAHNRNLPAPDGPDQLQEMLATVLVKQLRVQGFLFSDFEHLRPEFERDMAVWMASGAVQTREDIVQGLENAPEAFLGLFQGRNNGKLLVAVA